MLTFNLVFSLMSMALLYTSPLICLTPTASKCATLIFECVGVDAAFTKTSLRIFVLPN